MRKKPAHKTRLVHTAGNKTVTRTVPVEGSAAAGVLINGVTWATCNVDAPGTFAASPESAGMFYQWNRKLGWSSTDPRIASDGSKTWDNSDIFGDNWSAVNDPSPSGWRVPTFDDFTKLLDEDKVTNVWTKQHGVFGRKFTDNVSGASIFLPAAGIRCGDGSLDLAGSQGDYWSASSYFDDAWLLYFYSRYVSEDSYDRGYGHSLRCVRAE